MTYFAERLRAAMAVADVSRVEIARITGVSPQAVSKWTSGKSHPSSRALVTIAKRTGASLDWLMTSAPVDITTPTPERMAHLVGELRQILLGQSGGDAP